MSMILSDEQRKELAGPPPIRAIDPKTKKEYVLVPAELFEQVGPLMADSAAEEILSEVPTGIRRSKEAFLRDLPELLANPKLDRWWAGYHLDQRVGIARTKTELVLEIERRGIGPEDWYVGIIREHEPEPEEIESPDGRQFD
jgi:hypothetical protein